MPRYQEIQKWQADFDALQKTIDAHTDIQAMEVYQKQEQELHQLATQTDHDPSTILSREEIEENSSACGTPRIKRRPGYTETTF